MNTPLHGLYTSIYVMQPRIRTLVLYKRLVMFRAWAVYYDRLVYSIDFHVWQLCMCSGFSSSPCFVPPCMGVYVSLS